MKSFLIFVFLLFVLGVFFLFNDSKSPAPVGGGKTISIGTAQIEGDIPTEYARFGSNIAFLLITDAKGALTSESLDGNKAEIWAGSIVKSESPTITYKATLTDLEINGINYSLAMGRVFLASIKSGKVLTQQLNIPLNSFSPSHKDIVDEIGHVKKEVTRLRNEIADVATFLSN